MEYLGTTGVKSTSLYGPNYINANLYQMCGVYTLESDNTTSKNYAFYYSGGITSNDIAISSNYHPINLSYDVIYAHSIINNLCVVNCGNITPPLTIYSYIYNITNNNAIQISISGYRITTAYGIYNIDNSFIYTIVGGCSHDEYQTIETIYQNSIKHPYGYGYIMDYDCEKEIFLSPTFLYVNSDGIIIADSTVPILPNNTPIDIFIHVQGIGYYNNMYILSVDTVSNTGSGISTGYFIVMNKNSEGKFIIKNRIKIGDNYTANSVANNVVCGIYRVEESLLPYEAIIE